MLLKLSLNGEARVLKPELPSGLIGVYYPTQDDDQDKADFSDPIHYRISGRQGKALRFRRALQSRAELPDWHLPGPESQLSLAMWIKPAAAHIGVLVSCKTDSEKQGFALFVWGARLRFQFGDGTVADTLEGKAALLDGNWHLVEARFDAGQAALHVDGREVARAATEVQQIAPGKRGLFLGGYPAAGRGRARYAYDGDLDELVISRQPLTPVAAADATPAPEPEQPAIEVLAEPISGNEQHFGVSAFHTFRGRPVPLSFLFRGNPERCIDPAFVLYLPAGVKLREAFSSNHNGLDQIVPFDATPEPDGSTRLRSRDYDLTHRLNGRYGNGEILTLALDTNQEYVREAELAWSVENEGEEAPVHRALVRFLEPPADVNRSERGEFEIMGWSFNDDMAFFDPVLFKEVTELYKSSGLWGKGRWYGGARNAQPRRAALDLTLRAQGFTLYDVSLWHGPLGQKPTDDVPAATLRTSGKPDSRHLCPTALLTSERFRQAYEEFVRDSLCPPQDGDWVAIDFEPWGLPTKICYCERCLERFRKEAGLYEDLDITELPGKIWDYQDQWAHYWTRTTAAITAMMADAARKVDPRLRVVDYTYAYAYDSPEFARRLWSIPKDPRLVETSVDESMLSFYHLNDRAAFDMLATSLRHLKRPVSVILALSRANASQGSYTTPKESLSPARLTQKTLLCAAQGVRKVNLFPGRYIDGQHHLALGEASRTIWENERFYYRGQREDALVSLTTTDGRAPDREATAHTAWTHDKESLVTVFNFTATPLPLRLDLAVPVAAVTDEDGQVLALDTGLERPVVPITIPAHGTRLLTLQR